MEPLVLFRQRLVTPILAQGPVLFRGDSTVSFIDLFIHSSNTQERSVLVESVAKMGELENNQRSKQECSMLDEKNKAKEGK